jgi:hypothetical protein
MDSNQLKKGEIWFFPSWSSTRRNIENSNDFSSGHMGISFDRIDFFDENKNIYAFGPSDSKLLGKNWDNPVKGTIEDDIKYFKYFYETCSNNNDPLFKLNIFFSEVNKLKFLNSDYTYATPYNKEFDSLYYNCITLITKIINPIIEFNDIKIQFNDEFNEKTNRVEPGGWISLNVNKYSIFSYKLFKSSGSYEYF